MHDKRQGVYPLEQLFRNEYILPQLQQPFTDLDKYEGGFSSHILPEQSSQPITTADAEEISWPGDRTLDERGANNG